jgi:cell wall assembly regulator SMI1
MSQIAKELQYISAWLEYLNPDFVDCYNRGLTRQKINELTKDLPFKLPEEVYELYQWGNGVANDSPINFLFPEQLSSSLTITFG